MIKKTKPSKQLSNKTHIPELNKLQTLHNKLCNCLFWSPAGDVILLAGLGESASGSLEFYDLQDKTLVVKEHYRANAVLWDPSGRSVASVVSQPIEGGHFKFAMDNGYILWSFQGKQLFQRSYENFYQLQWRPRENILSKDEIYNKVIKNLKKYEKRFDRQDRERNHLQTLEETKEKRALRAKFRIRLARLKQFRDAQKEERLRLNDGYDSQDEANYVIREVSREIILEENTKTVHASS